MKLRVSHEMDIHQRSPVVVVVPIYKEMLSETESDVLSFSLGVLRAHDVCFVAPKKMLDISFYQERFSQARYIFFDNDYFSSPQAYSRLLLSRFFYQCFDNYSHILLVQTDAVVLKDELVKWIDEAFDYIGAPWPTQYMLTLPEMDHGLSGRMFILDVGNGGFSLRKVKSAIRALDDYSWLLEKIPMDEDLFFALVSRISTRFKAPNAIQAAHFALEREPRTYFKITNQMPMGGHAWEKWDKEFWLEEFAKVGLKAKLPNEMA